MARRTCCTADGEPTSPPTNPPGQPALAYRVGTWGTFREEMLALCGNGEGALLPLASTETHDPTVALIDAWAVVADILTFYQERIANEGYLRTATQQRSLHELAAQVGYAPSPGVAATAWLAVTVEDVVGAVKIATMTAGTRVMSIPGPGESPQTFEVSTDSEVRAAWNKLKPRRARPQDLAVSDGDDKLVAFGLGGTSIDAIDLATKTRASGSIEAEYPNLFPLTAGKTVDDSDTAPSEVQKLYFSGTDLGLRRGDRLLFVGRRDAEDATEARTVVLQAVRVTLDTANGWTQVDLVPNPAATGLGSVLRYQVAYPTGSDVWMSEPLESTARLLATAKAAPGVDPTVISGPATPTLSTSAEPGAYQFKERVGLFGHNAPRWGTLPHTSDFDTATDADDEREAQYGADWDALELPSSDYEDYNLPDAHIYLERVVPEVIPDTWLLTTPKGGQCSVWRVSEVVETGVAAFLISGRATGVSLVETDGVTAIAEETLALRTTTVDCRSVPLTLVSLPIEEPLQDFDADGAPIVASRIMLDGLVEGLTVGKRLALVGEIVDDDTDMLGGETAAETITISAVTDVGGYTTIYLEAPLAHRYVRDTVAIYGNLVEATHGETVTEVLGNGDASVAGQAFSLKRAPLTFVPAATASGAATTLTVRVARVAWTETTAFYGVDASAPAFTAVGSEGGATTITFGDGERGCRLPTGTSNVVASYRVGIGTGGNVPADSLSLLLSRPNGIRGVTNPLAAYGGAQPESIDAIRDNAPLRVRTLDRVVSTRDYADFAKSYAGIAKSRAVAAWQGMHRVVLLTVAADGGANLTAEQLDGLAASIRAYGDPVQRFVLAEARIPTFALTVEVLVKQGYDTDSVLASVATALVAAFAFDARDLGLAVTAAEVLYAAHQVAGVRTARVTMLVETGATPGAVPALLAGQLESVAADGTALGAGVWVLDAVTVEEWT